MLYSLGSKNIIIIIHLLSLLIYTYYITNLVYI
jgi:hypothetical protein